MKEAAHDIDDDNDNELINVYDRDNPVIEVRKFFPTMDEFRMCFKTYALRREFDYKTLWTDTKKFMQSAEALMEIQSGLIKSHMNILVLLVHRMHQL
jgi:hypothetical protein